MAKNKGQASGIAKSVLSERGIIDVEIVKIIKTFI